MTANTIIIHRGDHARSIEPVLQDIRPPQRLFDMDIVISSRVDPDSVQLTPHFNGIPPGMARFIYRITAAMLHDFP